MSGPLTGVSYAVGRTAERARVSKLLDGVVEELAAPRKCAKGVVWDEVALAGLVAKGLLEELAIAGIDAAQADLKHVPKVLAFDLEQLASTEEARPRVDVRYQRLVSILARRQQVQTGRKVSVLRVWNELACIGLAALGYTAKLSDLNLIKPSAQAHSEETIARAS